MVDAEPTWEKVIALHAELYEVCADLRKSYIGSTSDHVHVLVEIERRSKQLLWLLHQIAPLYEEGMGAFLEAALSLLGDPKSAAEREARALEIMDILELLCESYYVMAFRILDAFEKGPKIGLKSSAMGVNRARNDLVIHPDKNATQRMQHSFGMGAGRVGPVLKPSTNPNNPKHFNDPGLLPNAEQFAQVVLKALKAFQRGP